MTRYAVIDSRGRQVGIFGNEQDAQIFAQSIDATSRRIAVLHGLIAGLGLTPAQIDAAEKAMPTPEPGAMFAEPGL